MPVDRRYTDAEIGTREEPHSRRSGRGERRADLAIMGQPSSAALVGILLPPDIVRRERTAPRSPHSFKRVPTGRARQIAECRSLMAKDRLGSVRLEILVRPNAVRPWVGGTHDGALVVRVAEPADRGRATAAALRALAESFGVPTRNVTLVRGPTSRRKLVDIAARGEGEELLRSQLQRLLQAGD